jgi:hypothetical protein
LFHNLSIQFGVVGGLGCVGVKLNVVQKRWLCVLACTSFNFTKRWLFVLYFVGLFIVCRVSLGITANYLAFYLPFYHDD